MNYHIIKGVTFSFGLFYALGVSLGNDNGDKGEQNDTQKAETFFKEEHSSPDKAQERRPERIKAFFSKKSYTNFLGTTFSRVPITNDKSIFVAETEMTRATFIKLYKRAGNELGKWAQSLPDPQREAPHRMRPLTAVGICFWLTRLGRRNGELPKGVCYSLPTLNEWRTAASGGNDTLYCYGNDTSKLQQFSNYKQSGPQRSMLVGSFQPNKYGLYDMHGNAAEYCLNVVRENEKYVGFEAGGGSDDRASAVTSYSFVPVTLHHLESWLLNPTQTRERYLPPLKPHLAVRLVIVPSETNARLREFRADYRKERGTVVSVAVDLHLGLLNLGKPRRSRSLLGSGSEDENEVGLGESKPTDTPNSGTNEGKSDQGEFKDREPEEPLWK